MRKKKMERLAKQFHGNPFQIETLQPNGFIIKIMELKSSNTNVNEMCAVLVYGLYKED